MPSVIRSSFGPIVKAVQAQLSTVTGIPANRVLIIGRRKQPPTFSGPQDILLRSTPPVPQPEWFSGAGRVADVIRRIVTVALRNRNTLDSSDRDETFLLDPVTGLFAFEEAAFNALEGFMPQDVSGNVLVIEPMRLVQPNEEPNRSEADPAWGSSVLAYSVLYQPPLDQSVQ